jgi:hypothetical protein
MKSSSKEVGISIARFELHMYPMVLSTGAMSRQKKRDHHKDIG